MQEPEPYNELVRAFLAKLSEERGVAGLTLAQALAGVLPERVLAGVPPEQRLAGLDRDHQALALPVEVLRLLPEEYLRSLDPEVEAELRRRALRCCEPGAR